MTLTEIFKTNPSLLEEPEVKQLVEYVKEKHEKNAKIFSSKNKFYNKVLELCVHSDLMIIDGIKSEKVVESILELLNE